MENKKIGIMTFHASHNAGSMLQALALQHVLAQKYGMETEIIDYSNPAQQNMYAPLPQPKNWKQHIKRLIWATNATQLHRQSEGYRAFAKRYFRLSQRFCATGQELAAVAGDYRAIIAGSDQVWNIRCTDADDAYYLDFAPDAAKFAYAVSFGANNPFVLQNEPGHYETLIKAFRQICVREFNAQKWLREATGIEVPVCLDPTMLMDREDWEELVEVGDAPIVRGDYIFYYCFSITEEIQRFLHTVSKKYRMPVYFMDAKEWTLKACWRNGIRLVKHYGPAAYLNLVKHAKIFITTSFHGTAFATLYGKCFWYIDDGSNDPKRDDRALSFLTQLGLMDRYRTISELRQMDLLQQKDYTQARASLVSLRRDSFACLEKIVQEINYE